MRGVLLILAISTVAAGAYTLTPPRVIRPQAGLWTVEMRLERISGTGLPPGMTRAQLAEAMLPNQQPGPQTACRTAQQAASLGDRDSMRIHGFPSSQCRTTLSERSGETIRLAGTCRDRRGGVREFSINGTIGEQSVDLRTVYKDHLEGGARPGVRAEAEIHLTGSRVGPCGPDDVARDFDNMQRASVRSRARDTTPEASNLAATPDAAAP